MSTTLLVSPSSSSKKYALYSAGVLQMETQFKRTALGCEKCWCELGGQRVSQAITQEEFTSALEQFSQSVTTFISGHRLTAVSTVIIRVAVPGTFFQKHAVIDDMYVAELKKRERTAPVLVAMILKEVADIRNCFSGVTLVAASDSAFHADMPSWSREYSLSTSEAEAHDIHRFGYHGLSVASVVRRIHPLIGIDPQKMVVCHIGSEVSVTAIKAGLSVDCTLGYSVSTGLPMGSRGGDLDTAALLELMRAKNLRPAEAELYLNTNCGLQGLAGESDIRHLLERRAQADSVAIHTLDVFVYSIQKAIAAATVSLGGLEVLVFTATAAVRSSELRSLILKNLAHLGIEINEERNNFCVGKDGVISARNSSVKVVVMRAEGMGEMIAAVKTVKLPK